MAQNATTGVSTPSQSSQVVLPVTSQQRATSANAVTVDTTSIAVQTSSQPPSVVTISSTPAATASTSVNVQTTEPPQTTLVETTVRTAPPTTNSNGVPATNQQETVVITSTQPKSTIPATTTSSTSSKVAASKSSSAALAATSGNASTSSGLSPGGKIAVAVVVPVVAVALIVLAALFLWRKRKQRRDAEELRRKEVEEYGFNPNNDPTLPVVGGASSNGDEPSEMREADGSGYRGWGTTTSTNRKPSTTLSSGNGPIGMARSTSNSDNGRYTNTSPTAGTNKSSDVQSGDPLVGSPSNGRPLTADSETIGALGAVPTNSNNRQDIHRGPSNASSAYSGAHVSDTSGEGVIPGAAPGQQYYNDGLFYDEGMPQHGPYGDGSYGGGQPVIRDVQARRNTRIENPSIIPQQGNAGIAQNF